MTTSDPINNPMSSYNDVTDKYKLIPRITILVFAVAYLYAIYSNRSSEVIYTTGVLLAVMTVAYIIGVDSLKDIIDAILKHKHILSTVSETTETDILKTTTTTKTK